MNIVRPRKNYSAKPAPAAPLEITIPGACAGLRLDQALARLLPEYSRTRLARWVREARVTLDGRPARPREKLAGGESVRVIPAEDPRETADRPEAIPLDVVHEDAALLIINKPAGLVVHPGAANWRGTLL